MKQKNFHDIFQIIETSWNSQDFRLINFQDAAEKGVCYPSTKQTWVTIHQHKSIDDIIISSVEESLHQAIRDESGGMIDESVSMDAEHEEELVKRLFWAMNGWILG